MPQIAWLWRFNLPQFSSNAKSRPARRGDRCADDIYSTRRLSIFCQVWKRARCTRSRTARPSNRRTTSRSPQGSRGACTARSCSSRMPIVLHSCSTPWPLTPVPSVSDSSRYRFAWFTSYTQYFSPCASSPYQHIYFKIDFSETLNTYNLKQY